MQSSHILQVRKSHEFPKSQHSWPTVQVLTDNSVKNLLMWKMRTSTIFGAYFFAKVTSSFSFGGAFDKSVLHKLIGSK